MLRKSSRSLEQNIISLKEKGKLFVNLKDLEFTVHEISSLISESGTKTQDVMNVLSNNYTKIEKLIATKKITATEVARKLARTRTKIGDKIQELEQEVA